LTGAGAACLAGGLAACGTGGSTAAVATATGSWNKGSSAGASSGSGSIGSGSGTGSGGVALGAVSEIPEGGGKIFTADKIVVTQPKAGEYKAFSAICTHAQCVVDQISNETIDCPCHGSKFSITDGSVVAGPAPSPLPAKSIKVTTGGKIELA
jgi:nitrite reductase/ring-hydroxylating ferredoxin subunit